MAQHNGYVWVYASAAVDDFTQHGMNLSVVECNICITVRFRRQLSIRSKKNADNGRMRILGLRDFQGVQPAARPRPSPVKMGASALW